MEESNQRSVEGSGESQVVRVRLSLVTVSGLPARVAVDSDPARAGPGLFSGHLGKPEPAIQPHLGPLSSAFRVIVTCLEPVSGRLQSQPRPGHEGPARALSRLAEISPEKAMTRFESVA